MSAAREATGEKRPRMAWTPEQMDELRHHLRYQRTYREIARLMGTSEAAVKRKIHKAGMSRPDLKGFRVSTRLKGRKRPKAVVAKTGRASRERWADPQWREKALARIQDPEVIARREAHRKRANDRARGFSIPDDLREEYRFLRETKKFSAREAGQVLGLVGRQVVLA